MLSLRDREILQFIRHAYGAFLASAAEMYSHRAEVLAGIVMAESLGGLSKLLDTPGPGGRGDFGHGHGLCQIDDRSFPEFCASEDWKNPEKNILFAAHVLARKRRYIRSKVFGLSQQELERLSILAYNTGEGRVVRLVKEGKEPERATAHGNYGARVLAFARAYAEISSQPAETPV